MVVLSFTLVAIYLFLDVSGILLDKDMPTMVIRFCLTIAWSVLAVYNWRRWRAS